MRILSAAEAISPAIERTKAVLFQPFQLGRSWKLAVSAYLATLGAFFIPTPLLSFFSASAQPRTHLGGLLLSVGFGTVFSIVMFAFFYIGTRMEFVLFDIVLLNEKFVAPAWRRHRHQAWRWIGFKILFSLGLAAIIGPIFYVAFLRLLPQVAALSTVPGQPTSPHLLGTLLRFYAIIGLPIAFALLLSSFLTNFVLPSVALEDTTVREGLRRTFGLVASEPGPVSLFIVFKLILSIAGFLAVEAMIFIGEILCLIPVGLVALAGWFLLRSSGDRGHLLMVVGAILLVALFACVAFYFATIIIGSVHLFFQAFALYFLGGRYPPLGDLLEPPAPPVPLAPPQPPPPVTGQISSDLPPSESVI